MIVTPIKTNKVFPGKQTIFELLDEHIKELSESSVVAITSKIIALCENRVVVKDSTSRDKLVRQEADFFLPDEYTDGKVQLSIKQNTLIPASGVDESNSDGFYSLWPDNPMKAAREIRHYLKDKFSLSQVGVVITDASAIPLHYGTFGVPIGYSGFSAFKNYIGQKDLFGLPLNAGRSSIVGGLAAAAAVVMGEGTEQTPLAIISDAPFVEFNNRYPTQKEISKFFISHTKDRLFAPFLRNIKWQKGGKK